jgi:hypothetical protein
MSASNETVGYGLEEAMNMLADAGVSVSQVKRVGPAVTDANEQELVVRQKTDAKGVVELTVARRWVGNGRQPCRMEGPNARRSAKHADASIRPACSTSGNGGRQRHASRMLALPVTATAVRGRDGR